PRNRVALLVQPNLVQAFHSQRCERPEPNMQRHPDNLHSLRLKAFQYFRSEVQPGCRCCHRSWFPRKDCLVALAILRKIVAMNIGRQRHMTDAVEDAEEFIHRLEFKESISELPTFQNLGFECDGSVR